jgi:NAD(P)H-flavin reductase
VDRLEDGEVSPYLTQEPRRGDLFEVRSPIGGYFVWAPARSALVYQLQNGQIVIADRYTPHQGCNYPQ